MEVVRECLVLHSRPMIILYSLLLFLTATLPCRFLDAQVYEFAKAVKGRFGDGDFNLTILYNTSTYYDDLAWAAGWLYKATKQASSGG